MKYINDIEKILNNLGINGRMIAEKLRKCEEYESTGLEPEEVESYKAYSIANAIELSKVSQELKEYKELENKGLLIKLPCKIGDTVYKVGIDKISQFRVYCMTNLGESDFKIWAIFGISNKFQFGLSDIGRTVFLTQEEAENVLKLN